MPGVRPLLAGQMSQGLWLMPSREKAVARGVRGVDKSPRRLASSARRVWRAPRLINVELRPNKRMHATADTKVVMFLQRRGAARDARR